MLVQGSDAVEVGHLTGWWRRPPHVVFTYTMPAATPAEALAQLQAARLDPCPIDPFLLPQLVVALVNWEPLWIRTTRCGGRTSRSYGWRGGWRMSGRSGRGPCESSAR